MGVPVISVGVPTVVDAATVAVDLLGEEHVTDDEKRSSGEMVSPMELLCLLPQRN